MAGSTRLHALCRTAWEVFDTTTGDAKTIAFALGAIFGEVARRTDGVPVSAEVGEACFQHLDQPVTDAIDHLVGAGGASNVSAVLNRLTAAYALVRELLSP